MNRPTKIESRETKKMRQASEYAEEHARVLAKELKLRETQEPKPLEEAERPFSGMPEIVVRRDGTAYLKRELRPGRGGVVQVQSGGRKLSCSLSKLHRAVWPELWPGAAGPSPVLKIRDRERTELDALARRARKATMEEEHEMRRFEPAQEAAPEAALEVAPEELGGVTEEQIAETLARFRASR